LPSKVFTIDLVSEIQSIRRVASLYLDLICFGHGLAPAHKARQDVIDFASGIESKYDDVV
jgi:hypothetical protein